MTDTLASVHFTVQLAVTDHAAGKLLAAPSALGCLAAVARGFYQDWTRRTVTFVADLVALVDLTVKEAVAGLAAGSFVEFTAHSVCSLFATEAVHLRNKDVTRRTHTTMAGFTAWVDAESSFLLFAFESTRVGL